MNDETFTPSGVDEQIDRQMLLLWNNQAGQPSGSVVQRLHALYEEDLRSTARVWERLLRQAGEPDLAERQTERLHALSQEWTPLEVSHSAHSSRRQERQSSRTGQTRFGWRASLLVAVLVMIMLVGSLVVVLHEIRPNVPAGTSSYTLGQTVYSMVGGPEDPVFEDLAWSPDSQRIAALRLNGVQIWDATTGGNLVSVPLPSGMLRTMLMAWSPNGRWIAVSGLGTDAAIVDARTGVLVHQYSVGPVAESLPTAGGSSRLSTLLPASGGPGWNISGLVWSPNSQWLAVTIDGAVASRSFNIVDAQTGALEHRFTYDKSYAIDVASWSPDGKYLAASVMYSTMHSFQTMIWVWDMSTYQVVFQQNGIGNSTGVFERGDDQIVWQPQSDNLAFSVLTVGRIPKLTIALWDVARNKLLKRYTIARSGSFLVWSPDGTYLASSSDPNQSRDGQQIVIINAQSGQQVYLYKQYDAPLAAVAWSSDGKYIASADATVVKVWVAPQ